MSLDEINVTESRIIIQLAVLVPLVRFLLSVLRFKSFAPVQCSSDLPSSNHLKDQIKQSQQTSRAEVLRRNQIVKISILHISHDFLTC